MNNTTKENRANVSTNINSYLNKRYTLDEIKSNIRELLSICCNVEPTQGIDSGARGKAFECLIHLLFSSRRLVTSNNGNRCDGFIIDVDGFRQYYECKIGGGEMGGVGANGEHIYKFIEKDFVIYSSDATIQNTIVIDVQTFIDVIEQNKLYRTKANRNNISPFDKLLTLKSKSIIKNRLYDYPQKVVDTCRNEYGCMNLNEFFNEYKNKDLPTEKFTDIIELF